MTKRKPRGDHLWIGMGRGYREIHWLVNGLVASGRREPIAEIMAPTGDQALAIACQTYNGRYPLSVKNVNGTGVEIYEI